MDAVLEMCEQRGIAAVMCLDQVREFKGPRVHNFHPEHPYTNMVPYRADYPYMARNGGPCATENDFLTLPAARRQWKALQRYVVARWGASTAAFSWELWNEMDCFEGDEGSMASWTAEMAADFHHIDPYRHLVTTSLGAAIDDPNEWSIPDIDYVVYHDYGGFRYPNLPHYAIYWGPVSALARYHKPVLLEETNVTSADWTRYPPVVAPSLLPGGPKDSRGYAFHEALWSGFFATLAGTGMSWGWEFMIDPFDYYPQYRAVEKFSRGMPVNRERFFWGQPHSNRPSLDAFSRHASWGAVAWIVDRDADWRKVVMEGRTPLWVTGATLELPTVEDGAYDVDFVDSWTGNVISSQRAEAAGRELHLELPDFTVDLLVRAVHRDGR